jgi:uncharacterized Zn finger protein
MVEIKVVCDYCGQELETELLVKRGYQGDSELAVTPCDKCGKRIRQEAIDEMEEV